MTAKLLALYNQPADPAAFDAHYHSKHTPLAKKLPRLRSFTVSSGGVRTPEGGASPFHLVAELTFASMPDLQAALASSEFAAAAEDLGRFASAGVTVVMYETRET